MEKKFKALEGKHLRFCIELHEAMRLGLTDDWICKCRVIKKYREIVKVKRECGPEKK